MYDPRVGRFLNEDPEGFDAGDSNLYRYVRNNPTDAVDPSGMDEISVNGNRVYWVVQATTNGFWGSSQTEVARVQIGTIAGVSDGSLAYWQYTSTSFVQMLPQFEFRGYQQVRLNALRGVAERSGNGAVAVGTTVLSPASTNWAANVSARLNSGLEEIFNRQLVDAEYERLRIAGTLPPTISPTNRDTPIQQAWSGALAADYARLEIARQLGLGYRVMNPSPPASAVIWTSGGLAEQALHSVGSFTVMPSGPGIRTNGHAATRRAPEFTGGRLTETGFLRTANQWLGPGYRSLPNGRYVSADGLRQVRFGAHETRSATLHGHFEAYNFSGGVVIENTSVTIVPD